jgi:hypothetical protein
MANLTGEFDVVAEVSVDLLNAILGAVHENQDTNYPVMPHTLEVFVDDTYRGPGDPVAEADRTGIRSRVEVQVSTPTISLPVDTLLVRPPIFGGASHMMSRASARGPGGWGAGPDPLQGEISISPGHFRFEYPKVAARVRIRAWVRDPTEPALPEFIDGYLSVTTALVRSDVAGIGTFLTLDRSSGPSVTFEPAGGTDVTSEQRSLVAAVVRNFIRADTTPATFRVSLPPEVRFFDFGLRPQASRPSVLLMLTLDGDIPGTNAASAIAGGFIPDGAGFGLGVGRDYVVRVLRSRLFQGLQSSYHYSTWGLGATIRPDWEGASFDLQAGRAVFSLAGDGDISWWGADDHFTFSVRQAFTLQVVGGALEVAADGDPEVELSDVLGGVPFVGGFLEGKARDTIRSERDAALTSGASQIRDALDVGKRLKLIAGGIHPRPAEVSLSGVQIRPDGVLAFGSISLAATDPVVIAQVAIDGLRNAVQTWIPGGTIERLIWEESTLRRGTPSLRVEEHRFVTEDAATAPFGALCLTVEGSRVGAGGALVPVSASTCFALVPVIPQVVAVQGGGDRPLFPLEGKLPDGSTRVIGHYDPWGPGAAPPEGPTNLLVHFDAEDGDDAANLLIEAVEAAGRRDAAIVAVGVVGDAGYGRRQRELLPPNLLLMEDAGGRWAEAFGVSDRPATLLVGPQGEVVWREDEAITSAKLARALGKHAVSGGKIARHALRLAIQVGQRPPDALLRLADGRELSLRRLKGRSMALTFWSSRSEPSLEQLELLRGVAEGMGDRAPIIIAVGDGEGDEHVAELVRDREFPFLVLPDPDRGLSRHFGVWCWPSTIWITEDQRIEAIDLGLSNTRTSQR